MFKANNRIYKKQCFSKFDHMWVRKETHKNWMDGSIIILDFIGNMGESAGPVYIYTNMLVVAPVPVSHQGAYFFSRRSL